MRGKLKIALMAGVIAVAGGLALAGREVSGGETAAQQAPAGGAPQVPVAEVITRVLAPSAEFTGFLAAPGTVELRSRVGGTLETAQLPEGGMVRQGQVLFQIDPRPFQVALDNALAQLRQAEVLARQAQADAARTERLVDTGAVSRKLHEDALSARSARLAQVQAARAAVAGARLDLAYTRVAAPISGRVDRARVTEGNLVHGGVSGAATLLTTIVSVDPMHVYFDIDEATYLKAIRHGRPDPAGGQAALRVDVGLATDPDLPYGGVLDFVGNQVDRGTGTIRARAVLPNADGQLTPGLFARARLVTGDPRPTVLVDDQAVGTDQGKNYVLVVDQDQRVQYRPVQLGPMAQGLRVIAEGLQAGEKIILKGLVRPGMAITPRMVAMGQAEPAAGEVR